ncbi:leucyl aminopeptidase family protein [Sphingomonas sp. HDW15A]|uniref:leucyl aminopeptidase family protein n=1 Tax=Sphingomonas sp. HDW15A TaxID=2714942 RepID=UPI00140BC85B|nr:leucyl aminopeptidase family protein [Sphingomonas sp. HDW15A]QIK95650.1 leucyl aminopeptidase family protein [Sphingomonas sp. HDW15A]
MTDFSALLQPDRGQAAKTIHVVDSDSFDLWAKSQSDSRREMLKAISFDAKSVFQFALLQGKAAGDFEVVTCVSKVSELGPWCLAKLGESLPSGNYRVSGAEPGMASLGWMLAQHRFTRYKSDDAAKGGNRVLLTAQPAEVAAYVRLAEATALVRDLVDTPAADMGPRELEDCARDLAKAFDASVEVASGDALARDFPMIAAVGGGAARGREPRLIEIRAGNPKHPLVAIVGKGVCFDTGGLDIKPGSGMRLMKKDMGGAAHALALARLVMGAKLPIRLHVLIPAAENAVSGDSYRPGDVLRSRKGIAVEIDNTDAEGRLVLADALTRAVEEKPELLVDFATLTGAARVALGPDLPAFYANDESLAGDMLQASKESHDPVWRMPLWDDYDEMLKSDIADLSNSADSPMAGSVTAALFLRRFVPKDLPWAHFDTFAWRPAAKPGRPKGGEALGLRAAFALLESRYPEEKTS